MPGHLVALGGGGFSMETENSLLDDFVLSLARRRPARVCFVPTASADSATYIAKFYRAFSGRCIPADLTLFDPPALPRDPWPPGTSANDFGKWVTPRNAAFKGGAMHQRPYATGRVRTTKGTSNESRTTA